MYKTGIDIQKNRFTGVDQNFLGSDTAPAIR